MAGLKNRSGVAVAPMMLAKTGFLKVEIIIDTLSPDHPKIVTFSCGILKSFGIRISGKFAPKFIFLRSMYCHPCMEY